MLIIDNVLNTNNCEIMQRVVCYEEMVTMMMKSL